MDKFDTIKLLQEKQINPTRQRIEIARLFLERPQHLCAEQLIELLEDKGTGRISKATVYNTLNLFSEKGLLRELYVDAGKVYFDSNTSEHHHIYNVDTGEIWDVGAEGDTPALTPPQLPEGMSFLGAEVIYRVAGERGTGRH